MASTPIDATISRETREERREYKFKLFDRCLASVSAVGLISSGLFGLISYTNQKKADSELRRREIQLTIYREKKEVYYPLCESAAAIVSSGSLDEARKHVKDYMTLYYGKAHLVVIDPTVSRAKIEFATSLMDWVNEKKPNPPPDDLTGLALRLTEACQENLDPRKVLGP